MLGVRRTRRRGLPLLRTRHLQGPCADHGVRLAIFQGTEELKALAVDDALYCGVCQPRPEPISMDFLK